MTKRIVFLPDTQLPFEARKEMQAVIRFIGDVQPYGVVHIGDVLDLPQPSRWNRGTKGEFEGSVYRDADYAKKNLMEPLRKVYDGWIGMHEGNHDLRAREYLAKNAPALEGTHAFDIDVLLDFDGFGVELLPDFYDIAPGWISTHGHMGKMTLSQIAGSTALNGAKKFGKSVVCGHTHRQAVVSHSFGYGGSVRKTVTGMEVGHLMDMKKANYLKGGAGNWQMGFGMLTVDGKHVKAEIVPILGGKFIVDGRVWEV
ncbi:RDF protein [Mycobacterium phage Pari]|uniref:metallo-phosphoesterase n=1 Tax=Mycobacterium phage Pari TaxID=1718171 RepID=UPI000705E37C|nr:metallo-phosphoesterase [Mycobacterium phage Pari]ALH46814.1 RDF protein [Mycobacterium phage Pari]